MNQTIYNNHTEELAISGRNTFLNKDEYIVNKYIENRSRLLNIISFGSGRVILSGMVTFFLASIILLSSCNVKPISEKGQKTTYLPLKKATFIEKPFGYEPSIKNFTNKLVPPFKIQRYVVKNQHDPKQNDTIVKFYKGKTELFIYKTKFNQELFFAGNIFFKGLEFCNGVQVGMFRGAFFNSFTDLKYSQADTVKVISSIPGITYHFVFKKDKIESINIQHYID